MNELTPDEHNIIVDAIHDSATVIHKGQRMNERIKQITGQVLDEIVPETWVALGYDKIKEIQFRTAELIVRECARIARATRCPYEEDEVRQRLGHTWDMASLEAGSEIVKHFGVE